MIIPPLITGPLARYSSLDRTDFYLNLLRVIGGGGLFFYACWLMYCSQRDSDPHLILVGMGGLIISGKLLAPSIAGQLARPAGLIYSPGEYLDKPPPTYSRAHGHRAFLRYEEAITALWEIVADHPQELEAWSELIELALIELKDPARAREIFLEGRRSLSSPEKRRRLEDVWTLLGARAATLGIRETRDPVEAPPVPEPALAVLLEPALTPEPESASMRSPANVNPAVQAAVHPVMHEVVLELPVLQPLPGQNPPRA